jgi:hypothetical protein
MKSSATPMEAHYYWSGADFTLMDYLSILSTSRNTTFDHINVFFDEQHVPRNEHWRRVEEIERVRIIPARKLFDDYIAEYVAIPRSAITDLRTLSDLFRYCHLHRHGGAWFDSDTLQVRDVRQLTEGKTFFAAWESIWSVAIGVIYFQPGHPVLREVLRGMNQQLQSPALSSPLVVGPPFFTEIIFQLGLRDQLLPVECFYPVNWKEEEAVVFGEYPIAAETYSIHLWGHMHRHYFSGKTMEDFREVNSTYFNLAREYLKPMNATPKSGRARMSRTFRKRPLAPAEGGKIPSPA